MSTPSTVALLGADLDSTGLIEVLLNASLTGIIVLRPIYEAGSQEIIDFAYERLNPAAQQMLRLPARPPQSFLTLFPHAVKKEGVFAFYRDTYLSGQLARHHFNYQYDGLDGYFHLAAQPHGSALVVSFTDTNDQPRTAVEAALRESQACERRARAEAEQQKANLLRVFEQVTVAIALFQGPDYVIELANAEMSNIWGRPATQTLGHPVFEALPELKGQGFEAIFANVLQSGTPYDIQEVAVLIDRGHTDRSPLGYFNLTYRPQHDTQGNVMGIVTLAIEVTEQVVARQRLEEKEQQTALINEELRAANEEIRANHAEMERTYAQVRQLNEELEHRVAERTQQLEVALLQTQSQREQLRGHQDLLQHVLSQAPAAIATLSGPEHRFTFANAQYLQLVSRPVLGKKVAEALPELTEQGFLDLLNRVYTSGQAFRGDEIAVMLEQASGPAIQQYLDFTYQPLLDGVGQVQGILVFAVNMTEQVRSRQQARTLQAAMLAAVQRQVQERESFYQLLAQTPAAVAILRGPEHRYDYANAAYRQLFHSRAFMGQAIAEAVPEADAYITVLDEVYRTGTPFFGYEVPVQLIRAAGQPHQTAYFNFTYAAFRENEQIVGLSVFAYDVTEQVLAKQQRELQQQLVQSVFEQSPTAIFVMKGPTHILEVVNPMAAKTIGYPREQLLGLPFAEALPEAAAQGFSRLLTQVWQSGEAIALQEKAAHLAYHQPGEVGYFSFVCQPLHDEQGQVTRIACVALDVTDQVLARQQVQDLNEKLAIINEAMQLANQELNESNSRLTRTNADLDTFVYSASHDLKSPITNIEGLLLALRQHLPPEAQQAELVPQLLDLMNGAVQRFQQTLGHLTDVTRLQQTAFDQAPEAVNLAFLVEALRLDILPELTAAGATLLVDVARCPTIQFSNKNLRSILYNLLSNAIKYRAPDRPPHVRLHSRCDEAGQIVLEVHDNGLGLSEQQQSQLFRLFRRLHTHVSGSGVGLYMVKKMVDNAGGTLTVLSQLGVGSTFIVTLPAPR
jgi:PAS domain S-box-containing protein